MSVLVNKPFAAVTALVALCAPVAARLGAQQTGTVSGGQAVVRLRVEGTNPNQAQLDSLHALMRQLEQLTPGSPVREVVMRQIDELLPRVAGNSIVARTNVGPDAVARVRAMSSLPRPAGWIGLNVQGLVAQMVENNRVVVAYFDYPSIASVDPDSPAQHAGIAAGDMLIAYNGSDVVGHQFDLSNLLEPDKKISVTVQRAGDRKVFDMTVAKAPARIDVRRHDLVSAAPNDVYFERIITNDDNLPRTPVMAVPRGAVMSQRISGISVTPNGALGAIMSTVNSELAKTLNLETGVLVNDVSDGSPAAKAGLRPGDVIVDVDGQPVASLRALQEQVLRRRAEPNVTFQVMRDKKLRKITVNW
ncbi:MAG TPA: PDZ domain-containing protein [Gemmatimonadaceae bacterium]|jgi:predicted metalloprotease with PDZ domain